MPDTIEQLEGLAKKVASDGPTPRAIRARARKRVARRRLIMTVPVIAAVAAVALVQPWDQRADRTVVATDPPSTFEAPITSAAAPTGESESPATVPPGIMASGLTVTPVVDLVDGDSVGIRFDRPAEAKTAEFVAQCDGEVVDRAYDGGSSTELLEWCTQPPDSVASQVTVDRVINTSNGKVDCAANVGRCVIAAKLSGAAGTGALKWSSIGFTAQEPSELTIRAVPSGPLQDGSAIRVEGEGGLPGESILIAQCKGGLIGDESGTTCDTIRKSKAVVADDGTYAIDFLVFQEILTYTVEDTSPSTWVTCEPCYLSAARDSMEGESAGAEIDVEAVAAPIHPKVEVVEPGPYAPGQTVTLSGTGFQTDGGTPPSIALCTAALESQPFQRGCTGFTYVSDDDMTSAGTFKLNGVELPTAVPTFPDGTSCLAPDTCALGSVPGEGIAYLVSAPFSLDG